MSSLKVVKERVIQRSAADVFQAVSEGKLFMNCSADSRDIEIDFRVGGKYHLNFSSHGVTNFGEFLEIIPNKKIVFSWCQDFEEGRKPDTTVTIEFFEEGKKTKLVLTHTGFKDKDVRDDHEGGWNSGVDDLATELEKSQIRMERVFQVPVDELFETCLKELKKDIVDSASGKSIRLKGNADLQFAKEEKWGKSSIELLQSEIPSDQFMVQRKRWDELMAKLRKQLHQ